jgi:ribosome-associated toxin RatA of RatAB toxin-antitoxin module
MFIICLFSSDLFASEETWEEFLDREGITLFRRCVKNSNFFELKGVTVINAEIETVGRLLLDIPEYPKWMAECRKAKILNQSEDNCLVMRYIHNSAWPVKDREVTLSVNISIDRKARTFMVSFENMEGFQDHSSDHFVKMNAMRGKWIVESLDQGQTRVTYIFFADPGGLLPPLLVNRNVKTLPFYTLQGLRSMTLKEKYITPKH